MQLLELALCNGSSVFQVPMLSVWSLIVDMGNESCVVHPVGYWESRTAIGRVT